MTLTVNEVDVRAERMLHDCGIDSDAIVAAARRLAELGPQIGSAAAAGTR